MKLEKAKNNKDVSGKTSDHLARVATAYLKAHPKRVTLFGGLVPLYVNQESAIALGGQPRSNNNAAVEMKTSDELPKQNRPQTMLDLYQIYNHLPSQQGAIAIAICEAFRREYGDLYQTMLSIKNPCEVVQGMADEAAVHQMAMEAVLQLTP